MPDLHDGDRVVTAATGDDKGIWFEDVISIHGDIREASKEREASAFPRIVNYYNVATHAWYYHATSYYLYTQTDDTQAYFPVCLPVGSVIREVEAEVTGAVGLTGGNIQFNEYSPGSVTTSIDIEAVAHPWDTGGVGSANMVTYTQTTAHASLPMVIKPTKYYLFLIQSPSNSSIILGDAILWNLKYKYQPSEH